MADGLRLMIYDTSDVRRTWKYDIDKDGNPEIDLAVELGLSHSWAAGGGLYKAFRTLDACRGFDKWNEALMWLADYRAPERIAEIQYWGHGSPGFIWMKSEALSAASAERSIWTDKYGVTTDVLNLLKRRLTPESVIWFRTCSTFAGERGHQFAKSWANNMKCRVAGYTHIIGPWQSGLHSLAPEQEPSWPAAEGILEGTPAQPKKLKWSSPLIQNTVTCLHSRIPKGW